MKYIFHITPLKNTPLCPRKSQYQTTFNSVNPTNPSTMIYKGNKLIKIKLANILFLMGFSWIIFLALITIYLIISVIWLGNSQQTNIFFNTMNKILPYILNGLFPLAIIIGLANGFYLPTANYIYHISSNHPTLRLYCIFSGLPNLNFQIWPTSTNCDLILWSFAVAALFNQKHEWHIRIIISLFISLFVFGITRPDF